MILGLASISYLLFVRMTYASCSARGQPNDVIDALTDFRTATPFTYTETVYAFDCSTDPTTFTAYVWITISSSIYTANACTYTLSTDPIDYCLHIFPSLMATQFIPGSPIVVSGLNIPQMQSALTITIPPITLTVTPSTSTTLASQSLTNGNSTSTSRSAPTSFPPSSSNPIGGIVGGVIGAVVVIGVAFAFAWYRIRTNNSKRVQEEPSIAAPIGDINYQSRPNRQEESSTQEMQEELQGAPALKYQTITHSGNLDGTGY